MGVTARLSQQARAGSPALGHAVFAAKLVMRDRIHCKNFWRDDRLALALDKSSEIGIEGALSV